MRPMRAFIVFCLPAPALALSACARPERIKALPRTNGCCGYGAENFLPMPDNPQSHLHGRDTLRAQPSMTEKAQMALPLGQSSTYIASPLGAIASTP